MALLPKSWVDRVLSRMSDRFAIFLTSLCCGQCCDNATPVPLAIPRVTNARIHLLLSLIIVLPGFAQGDSGESCRLQWQDFHFGLAILSYHAMTSNGNSRQCDCPQIDNLLRTAQRANLRRSTLTFLVAPITPAGLSRLHRKPAAPKQVHASAIRGSRRIPDSRMALLILWGLGALDGDLPPGARCQADLTRPAPDWVS